MKDRKIKHIIQVEFAQLHLWEKVVLFFCSLHTYEEDRGRVTYKFFFDRLYVYSRVLFSQQQIEAPSDGGYVRPWVN